MLKAVSNLSTFFWDNLYTWSWEQRKILTETLRVHKDKRLVVAKIFVYLN